MAAYRSALRSRDLRLLLTSLVISATGSWAYNVAMFAYVYDKTHSLGWISAAGLARFLPALVLSSYGGVIADRFEKRKAMIGADMLCLTWQAGMAAVAAASGPAIAVIALASLTACCTVVEMPAAGSMIPRLVGEDDLAAANALNGMIDNVVVIAGPGIGAGLLALGSASAVFAVNAASFGVAAVIVSRLHARIEPAPEEGGPGVLAQITVGLRAIARSTSARVPVALCALVTFVYGTDTVLFVGVSVHKLGTGPRGLGYLMAGLGVGGILMGFAVDRLAASRRLALVIVGGAVVYCLPTALLTVIHSPGLAIALQVVRGGATLIVDVLAITALQRAVPADVAGRVLGVFFAITLGAVSLGSLITSPIVAALGLNAGLLIMAFVPAALAVLGYPSLARLDRASAERVVELAPRVAVLERLGLFAGAGRTTLERLAAACTEVSFAPGESIVREGDEADALYVLVEGEVEVTARGETGVEPQRLRTMGPDSYFGEIGLLEGIPRTATVTALEECRCYRIGGEDFLDLLTNTPPAVTLIESARSRLEVTHPSRRLSYADAAASGT